FQAEDGIRGDLVTRVQTCALPISEETIGLEPFRETGYRLLMEAHAAAGNRAEALRVYDRCRRLLADELGTYPSPETESIYRDLRSEERRVGEGGRAECAR